MSYIEQESKFTFKDFIVAIQTFATELRINIKWLLLSMLLLAGLFCLYTSLQSTTYTAQMTFVVKSNSSNDLGVGGIIGRLGLGSGRNAAGVNLDRLIAFAKSENIIRRAIFQKVTIDGRNDFIANHFIDIYDYHEQFSKLQDTLSLQNPFFYFQNDSLKNFSIAEHLAFDQLYSLLVYADVPIMNIVYGDQTGILVLRIKSLQEDLSIVITEAIYQELKILYELDATENSKMTYQVLLFKADSVRKELNKLESRLAYQTYLAEGIISNKERLNRTVLQREVNILASVYTEILKNKETTTFMLQNQTPFFQVVDQPHKPLETKIPSKFWALILGAFLGLFLSIFFFFTKTIYRNAMAL